MRKHILTVLLLCLLLTVTLLLLVSCNDKDNTPTPDEPEPSADTGKNPGGETTHTHSFGTWTTTKAANCTEDGVKERVCSCGEKETETISATGHTEVIDPAVTATEAAAGKTEGKHCSVCEKVLEL